MKQPKQLTDTVGDQLVSVEEHHILKLLWYIFQELVATKAELKRRLLKYFSDREAHLKSKRNLDLSEVYWIMIHFKTFKTEFEPESPEL